MAGKVKRSNDTKLSPSPNQNQNNKPRDHSEQRRQFGSRLSIINMTKMEQKYTSQISGQLTTFLVIVSALFNTHKSPITTSEMKFANTLCYNLCFAILTHYVKGKAYYRSMVDRMTS